MLDAKQLRTYLAEGVAIVLSILLAFAIDAWWTNHQAALAETHQLRAL